MKVKGLIVLLFALALVGTVGPVRQTKAAADGCHKINAQFAGAYVIPPDCPSPLGLCTQEQIIGGGLLTGTSRGHFVAAVPLVATGLPVSPTILSYVFEFVITTERGTLTLRDTGIFDQASGEFTDLSRVVGGTERFEGASGTLFLNGKFTDATSFEGDISGEICLAY